MSKTWFVGLRGVAPLRTDEPKYSKRRNPMLTKEDKKGLEEWSKMRSNPYRRRKNVAVDWTVGERSGRLTDKMASKIKDSKDPFEQEVYSKWLSGQEKQGEKAMVESKRGWDLSDYQGSGYPRAGLSAKKKRKGKDLMSSILGSSDDHKEDFGWSQMDFKSPLDVSDMDSFGDFMPVPAPKSTSKPKSKKKKDNLNSLTVKELKKKAKKLGISGAYKMRKSQLVRKIRSKKNNKSKSRSSGPRMDRRQLISEARNRGIQCRSYMSNADLRKAIKRHEKKYGAFGPFPTAGRKAKYGQCRPKSASLKSAEALRKQAKRLGIGLTFQRGPKKGRRKDKQTLAKDIRRKGGSVLARRRNPFDSESRSVMSRRRNPWWKNLVDGGESHEVVMKNPIRRSNMGRLDLGSRFGAVSKRRRRRRRNPLNWNQEFLGVRAGTVVTAAFAAGALQLVESGVSKYLNLNLDGFGRIGAAAAKLGIGLGGAAAAEKVGLLEKNSQFDRFVKLAAVFSSASDISSAVINSLGSSVEALGLGEYISHPASNGQVVLSQLGELSYNPYALGYAADAYLGNIRKAPNQSLYTIGEAVAPAAAKGDVVVSNLGYASDQYGDKVAMNNLGGAFYAGNVSVPQGASQHPDFMNQVPGRSDLSAVPDFMR